MAVSVLASASSGLRLKISSRLRTSTSAVRPASLRHPFKAEVTCRCTRGSCKGLFSSAQPYRRRKPGASAFSPACAQTVSAAVSVGQPAQKSSHAFQSPALWLLASAAATFCLSRVIDGKGLMLLSSLLVYKLSQWPAKSLWSMILTSLFVASYRPALALCLGAVVSMAAVFFKTPTVYFLRLHYPLYQGVISIPRAMADWIMHNASLTSHINSMLAWGPWVLLSLGVCLQCAIWIASIMRLRPLQQPASGMAHSWTEGARSKTPGVPAAVTAAPIAGHVAGVKEVTASSAVGPPPTAAATAAPPEATGAKVVSPSEEEKAVQSSIFNQWPKLLAEFRADSSAKAKEYEEVTKDGNFDTMNDWLSPDSLSKHKAHAEQITELQEKLLQRASEVCNLQQAMEALAIERDCLQDKLKAAKGEHEAAMSEQQSKAAAAVQKAAGDGLQEAHQRAWAVQAKLQKAWEDQASLEQQVAALTNQLAAAKASESDQQRKLTDYIRKLAEAEAQTILLQAHIGSLQDDLQAESDERVNAESLNRHVDSLQEQLTAANAQLADSLAQADSLQQQLTAAQGKFTEGAATARGQQTQQAEVWAAQKKALNKHIRELQRIEAKAAKDRAAHAAELREASARAATAQHALSQTEQKYVTAAFALDKAQAGLKDTQTKLAQAQAKLKDTQSKLETAEQKFAADRRGKAEAQDELNSHQVKLAEAHAELAGTQTKLDEAQSQLQASQTKLMKTEQQAAADLHVKAKALKALSKLELQHAKEVSSHEGLHRKVQELEGQAVKDRESKADEVAKLHKLVLKGDENYEQSVQKLHKLHVWADKRISEEVNMAIEAAQRLKQVEAKLNHEHSNNEELQNEVQRLERQLAKHSTERAQQEQAPGTAAAAVEEMRGTAQESVKQQADKSAKTDSSSKTPNQARSKKAASPAKASDADFWDLPHPGLAQDWKSPAPQPAQATPPQPTQAIPLDEAAKEIKVEAAESGVEAKVEAAESATGPAWKEPSLAQRYPELAAEWDSAHSLPLKAVKYGGQGADEKQRVSPKVPNPTEVLVLESTGDGEGVVEVLVEGHDNVSNADAGSKPQPSKDRAAEEGEAVSPAVNWLLNPQQNAPIAESPDTGSNDGVVEVSVHEDLLP